MPRTSALECQGCPPIRAITTDNLGLVKVVEARGKEGKAEIPKVVDTWGSPDASRAIHAASFSDNPKLPLLALARKDNSIEFLNPLNGQSLLTTKVAEPSSDEQICKEDPIVALHFLNSRRTDLPSKLNVILTCTENGKSCLRSVALGDSTIDSQSTWDVCKAGKVICCSVNAKETHALFGGKGIELNVWDLDRCNKTWTSKAPRPDSLGIYHPTWFTAATFLSKEDHHKIVAGTNDYQIRLYDISAQRKAVISFNFRESPIKAVTPDLDGNRIYVGTAFGDLASFDMRTGKMIGCFIGKCCGSIRSIARHPELPLLASCGLDRYLRIWNTNSRQLLSAVFLKQHLTNVMFDSHVDAGNTDEQPSNLPDANDIKGKESYDEDNTENNEEEEDKLWISSINEEVEKEKQKLKKKKKRNKAVTKQNNPMKEGEPCGLSEDDTEELSSLKRRKSSSNGKKEHSKKLKKSKSKRASVID